MNEIREETREKMKKEEKERKKSLMVIIWITFGVLAGIFCANSADAGCTGTCMIILLLAGLTTGAAIGKCYDVATGVTTALVISTICASMIKIFIVTHIVKLPDGEERFVLAIFVLAFVSILVGTLLGSIFAMFFPTTEDLKKAAQNPDVFPS